MLVASPDGLDVVVHDLGGDGPPLLICHATGFCAGAYRPLGRLLAVGRHVWGVDLNGHGDTGSREDFEWMPTVLEVIAVVEALGGGVFLVGHSMGGAVGLQAAHDRPELFTGAYLYEPIVFNAAFATAGFATAGFATGRPNVLAVGARNRREVFPSREVALWRYAGRPPLDVLGAGSLQAYVQDGFEDLPDGTVRLKCRGETEARTFEASGGITVETVAGASLPVVIARGESSESPVAALSPVLADALPAARLVTYRHLGHFGPFQDPVTVAGDVPSVA
jgi:pimeloyl-ACP methyl ester carboxylesterase